MTVMTNVIVFSPQDVIRTLAHWASWCTDGLKEPGQSKDRTTRARPG